MYEVGFATFGRSAEHWFYKIINRKKQVLFCARSEKCSAWVPQLVCAVAQARSLEGTLVISIYGYAKFLEGFFSHDLY